MQHPHNYRNFKGGAWDLRKDDRRKEQMAIAFPDRRSVDRRAGTVEDDILAAASVTWIKPFDRDE